MRSRDIACSILDLAWIVEGGTPADAFRHASELAQLAEQLGYRRFWVAEHHNSAGVASCATSVVLGYIAAATQRIRVGSGGVMLPNHAPLLIAEQFGTLDALYPGRIDLGLGRAPGTDRLTVQALRRDPFTAADSFPQDVLELQRYFAPLTPEVKVAAIPAAGRDVPLWILGSSTYGAQVAAAFGLPYAFASHFAPQALHEALAIYRNNFQPSAQLREPYAMVCVNVFCADTDAEAQLAANTLYQMAWNLRFGRPNKLQLPKAGFLDSLSELERATIQNMRQVTCIGAPESVAQQLLSIAEQTQADELMIVSAFYDHAARLHSYRLTKQALDALLTAT